jgi:hypothetical protein
MRRVNKRQRGNSSWMRLHLVLNDERRGEHERSIDMKRALFPGGFRTLYRVTAPPHVEGISLLLNEDRDRPGMWMHFSSSNRLIPVVTRGLSALASDFSCEDLKNLYRLDEYNFRTLRREPVAGQSTLVIEMIPKTEMLQRELGYTRSVGWIREDIWLVVRAEYHDASGRPFKTFRADEVERVQGIWTARKYSMVNHRARHRSDVEVLEVRYGISFPGEKFEPEALERPAAELNGAGSPARGR